MSGRVTVPGDPDDVPTMRERSPLVWWVAVIAVVGLIVGTFGSALLLVLS